MKIFLVKKWCNTATTVQSDEIAPLTDSRLKQTTHYLINNIACRRKRGRGRDHLAKKREEEGEGTAPYLDKEARFQ